MGDRDLRDLQRLLMPIPPWWMAAPGKSEDWMLWHLSQ